MSEDANPSSDDAKPDLTQHYLAIWSKAVDTQMHFNEMSVKARQFGLTFVAAALGLAVVVLSRGQEFAIVVPVCGGFNLHATVLIVFASAFALWAVRLLDLNVYHKMLRGAVSFGEDFEQNYMRRIFDLDKGMTQAISHFSRFADASVVMRGEKYVYAGSDRQSAERKIRSFYNFAVATLCGLGILLFIITAHFGHPVPDNTVKAAQTSASESPRGG